MVHIQSATSENRRGKRRKKKKEKEKARVKERKEEKRKKERRNYSCKIQWPILLGGHNKQLRHKHQTFAITCCLLPTMHLVVRVVRLIRCVYI